MVLDEVGRFNEAWSRGRVTTPLVILIGGAAGVGKSTLAQQLAGVIPHLNAVSTSVLRASARVFVPEAENPALFQHTFDLDSVERLLDQARPINRIVNQMIRFAASERQHWLIEGSSLVPGEYPEVEGVILVEVYLKVSDPRLHARMTGGPTHNRALTAVELRNCRLLHDYIVASAERRAKPVFEYTDAYAGTIALLKRAMARALGGGD